MRITPWAADAVVISTMLAGIRRAGHFEYPMELIQNTTLRWLAHHFLYLGEMVLDCSLEIAKNHPDVFKPLPPRHPVIVVSDPSFLYDRRVLQLESSSPLNK
jgi:hypothetical protein